MPTYRPLTDIPISLFTNSSTQASGYVLRAYLTGLSTPTPLYSDAAGTEAGTSVELDARGEFTTIKRVWIDTAINYKLRYETDEGVEVWTVDPVYGSPRGDASSLDVTATSTTNSRPLSERFADLRSIEDFGDPVGGDWATVFAAAYASGLNYKMTGSYTSSAQLEIGDQTVYSFGAHITHTTTDVNNPAVRMHDDSSLLGDITITMPNADPGTENVHLLIGGGASYTEGSSRVRVGKVTILGGYDDMAGVLVMGASEDVYIEEVNCPDNPRIGQPFGCHWGNFDEHYLDGSDYTHAPGAAPTTHPKGVRVDRVIVGEITQNDGITNAGVFISSSRDISIGYLQVANAAHAAVIYPGDIGFEYADADTKAAKMYGIEIEKIVAKTRSHGIIITGATSFPSVATSNAEVEFTSEYVRLEATSLTGNNDPGISTEKVSRVDIGSYFCKYYGDGMSIGSYSKNVTLTCPRIQDCDLAGIKAAGLLNGEVENLTVIAPYISNVNRNGSSDPGVGSGICLSRTTGATIIGGIIGTSGADTQYGAFDAISTCTGITVENVKSFGSVSGTAFFANSAPTDQVSFLNCSCASGMTLRTGGTAAMMLDQRKVVFVLAEPSTGTYEAGDIAIQRAPSLSGLPVIWQCIVGGTPGTWRAAGQAGARLSIGSTPEFIGQIAVVSGVGYIAVDTASSADWLQITP